jgi:hypothetical protein
MPWSGSLTSGRGLELAVGGDRGVVEDRPRRSGDADAPLGPDFVAAQTGMAMDPQAGTGAFGRVRDHDLREPRLGAPHRPLERGRGVAERRATATREHRGEPPAVPRQVRVADCVDARVHAVQSLHANAPSDRRLAEAQAEELPPRHNPMLPTRELGEPHLGR